VQWCDKALKYSSQLIQEIYGLVFFRMDSENAKIILRRGKAKSLGGDFDEAVEDLKEASRLDPSLQIVVDAVMTKNSQRKRAAFAKQKKQFRNFFDRK